MTEILTTTMGSLILLACLLFLVVIIFDMLNYIMRNCADNKNEEITKRKGFFTNPSDTLNTTYTSTTEIRKAIRKSKRKSAAGPDGLKMSVYSEACENLILPLQALFNTINSTGLIPDNFKTAKVILLHKKKSKQNMANYRPISMSNHISKIWERIVNNRLMNHLEKNNQLSQLSRF